MRFAIFVIYTRRWYWFCQDVICHFKILRTSNIGGYSTLKDTFVETPKRIWLHLWTIEDEQIGCVYTFWLAMPPDIGFET